MEVDYLLRHFLVALRYRCSKAITNVQDNYPSYDIGSDIRKPIEILSHISFVLRCAQSVFNQDIELHREQRSWNEEVDQFYKEIIILDKYITEGIPDREKIIEKLLQGPLSDAMTHVGQLSMIRRISGDPIAGETFLMQI